MVVPRLHNGCMGMWFVCDTFLHVGCQEDEGTCLCGSAVSRLAKAAIVVNRGAYWDATFSKERTTASTAIRSVQFKLVLIYSWPQRMGRAIV